MKIIENSYDQLMIRFGNAILPAVVFVFALVIGLGFAIYGSTSDLPVFIVVGALFAIAGFLRLIMEKHVTLTFDRPNQTLNVRQRHYLVPSNDTYPFQDIRQITALCDGQLIDETPPDANVRCDLVIDFISMPDYAVKRNLSRADANRAVNLIRQFLQWD